MFHAPPLPLLLNFSLFPPSLLTPCADLASSAPVLRLRSVSLTVLPASYILPFFYIPPAALRLPNSFTSAHARVLIPAFIGSFLCLDYKTQTLLAMDSEWSLNYCLSCDRQTSERIYCSQACRLRDLETSSSGSGSEPASPRWCTTPTSSQSTGLQLQPAFDFTAYRPSNTSSASRSGRAQQDTDISYYSKASPKQASSSNHLPPKRALTPSSSQSSLNSTKTTTSQSSGLADQARSELRTYADSFDLIRTWRRRLTSA